MVTFLVTSLEMHDHQTLVISNWWMYRCTRHHPSNQIWPCLFHEKCQPILLTNSLMSCKMCKIQDTKNVAKKIPTIFPSIYIVRSGTWFRHRYINAQLPQPHSFCGIQGPGAATSFPSPPTSLSDSDFSGLKDEVINKQRLWSKNNKNHYQENKEYQQKGRKRYNQTIFGTTKSVHMLYIIYININMTIRNTYDLDMSTTHDHPSDVDLSTSSSR